MCILLGVVSSREKASETASTVQQQGPIVVKQSGNEKSDSLQLVSILNSWKNQYNQKRKRFKPEGISGQQKADFHPDHQ